MSPRLFLLVQIYIYALLSALLGKFNAFMVFIYCTIMQKAAKPVQPPWVATTQT